MSTRYSLRLPGTGPDSSARSYLLTRGGSEERGAGEAAFAGGLVDRVEQAGVEREIRAHGARGVEEQRDRNEHGTGPDLALDVRILAQGLERPRRRERLAMIARHR